MAEQILDHVNVDALFQEMGSEAVPQCVHGDGLVETCGCDRKLRLCKCACVTSIICIDVIRLRRKKAGDTALCHMLCRRLSAHGGPVGPGGEQLECPGVNVNFFIPFFPHQTSALSHRFNRRHSLCLGGARMRTDVRCRFCGV
jgi:hypothetical protein